jgi:anaerobic dimethyl sulfoxide reductase subunit C (anchor subunit)
MSGFWSLVFFTLLAQGAVGFILCTALTPREAAGAAKRARVALGILIIAGLVSLTHLSSPLISFYALGNLGSSWLSREILALLLTGAAVLLWVTLKNDLFGKLAALLGLGLILTMSQVYLVANQPAWDSGLTIGLFFGATLSLGGALSFCLDSLSAGKECGCGCSCAAALPRSFTAPLPLLFLLGILLGVVCALARGLPTAQDAAGIAHIALLLVGAAAFAAALGQSLTKPGEKAERVPQRTAALALLAVCIAEFCGRINFYAGYTGFGG